MGFQNTVGSLYGIIIIFPGQANFGSIIFWTMGSEHSGLPVWHFPNTVVSLYGVFFTFFRGKPIWGSIIFWTMGCMILWFWRLSKTVVGNYCLDAFCALFVPNLDLFVLAWFLGRRSVWYKHSVSPGMVPGNQYLGTNIRELIPVTNTYQPIPIKPINPSTHQPINPVWHYEFDLCAEPIWGNIIFWIMVS